MRDRDALIFIDNNSSKDALVRGISASHASSLMVKATRLTCAQHAIAAWYDRVPSPSNLADAPSRREFEALLAMGAVRVAPMSLPDLGVNVFDL